MNSDTSTKTGSLGFRFAGNGDYVTTICMGCNARAQILGGTGPMGPRWRCASCTRKRQEKKA